MAYAFVSAVTLKEGYIPIHEDASRRAFGDPDFLSHLTFIDDDGVLREVECPEIEREMRQIIRLAIDGKRVIMARPRAGSRQGNKYPPIGRRYEEIPPEYFRRFRHNDWTCIAADPFSLVIGDDDPREADWFFPAVAAEALLAVESHGEKPACSLRPVTRAEVDAMIAASVQRYVADSGRQNINEAFRFFCDEWAEEMGERPSRDDRFRPIFQDITGHRARGKRAVED